MNPADSALILGLCGFIIAAPIVAVAGLFFYRRWQRGQSSEMLATDVGMATQSDNGDVAIRNNTGRNLVIIGFFAGTLLIIGLSALSEMSRGRFEMLVLFLIWGLVTVPTIWLLTRSLLKPSLFFHSARRVLEIKMLTASREVPFGELQSFTLETWEKQVGRYRNQTIPCARLGLRTRSGEVIDLGNLSSMKNRDDLLANCEKICRMISQITGLQPPAEITTRSSVSTQEA